MASPPQAVIIAGPNGSGKSTCAATLLPENMPFINADMIAAELTGKPGTPGDINAGRLLLERLADLESERSDFAFETTLATKKLAGRVQQWQSNGYRVHLLYFWLPSADLAVQRVAGRVKAGGHNVPETTIRRRFEAGLRLLFSTYMPLVDTWRLYDNSQGFDPEPIARRSSDGKVTITTPDIWNTLRNRYPTT